jgi:hypothetical protein
MSKAKKDFSELPPFEPGIYLHFKGGRYIGLWLEHDSEDKNAFRVCYYSIEKQRRLSRPYASSEDLPDYLRCGFTDQVQRPGYEGPRFRLLQPAELSPQESAEAGKAVALAVLDTVRGILKRYDQDPGPLPEPAG